MRSYDSRPMTDPRDMRAPTGFHEDRSLDRDDLSDLRGVLTPAAAMGDALLARFPAAGVSLETSRLN